MGGERDFRKTAVEKRASHPRGTERNEEEEEEEKERERGRHSRRSDAQERESVRDQLEK